MQQAHTRRPILRFSYANDWIQQSSTAACPGSQSYPKHVACSVTAPSLRTAVGQEKQRSRSQRNNQQRGVDHFCHYAFR